MPNAKDIERNEGRKEILCMAGGIGSGKTSQFLTLPGKKFLYVFDPSAINTLKGHDVDYEIFYPSELNLAARSLKSTEKKPQAHDKPTHLQEPTTYIKFEEDYANKKKDGFFDQYDNIGMDSFTTFADIVMDRILWLNGRPGKWPEQEDWAAQQNTIRNVVRDFVGYFRTVFFTAHTQPMQDELTHKIQNQILLTGQLRIKLPLLFSEIYYLECRSTESEELYIAQTRQNRQYPFIRCTLRRKATGEKLKMFEDFTIRDWKKPENYGLGKLLKECL